MIDMSIFQSWYSYHIVLQRNKAHHTTSIPIQNRDWELHEKIMLGSNCHAICYERHDWLSANGFLHIHS